MIFIIKFYNNNLLRLLIQFFTIPRIIFLSFIHM